MADGVLNNALCRLTKEELRCGEQQESREGILSLLQHPPFRVLSASDVLGKSFCVLDQVQEL
jgi:hypothetical protein